MTESQQSGGAGQAPVRGVGGNDPDAPWGHSGARPGVRERPECAYAHSGRRRLRSPISPGQELLPPQLLPPPQLEPPQLEPELEPPPSEPPPPPQPPLVAHPPPCAPCEERSALAPQVPDPHPAPAEALAHQFAAGPVE